MKISVKGVKAKSTIKPTPTIFGDPTYHSTNELREALYVNADAILTNLGGVYNGHV